MIPPIILLLVVLVIYFRMLLYSGFVQWGNFGFPLIPSSSTALDALTWNPFSYNGMPVLTPWIDIFSVFSNIIVELFGSVLSLNIAVKSYIIMMTFFMVYSFYLLTREFYRNIIARTFSSLFILGNPLILQLVGQGDPYQFSIWGIYFISVLFLSKSLKSTDVKKIEYQLCSVLLLSVTVAVPQIFYLGVPLYFAFIFYFTVIDKRLFNSKGFILFLKNVIFSTILLIPLVSPLILTTFFGAFNLSPSSNFANPLSNFEGLSVSFSNMLLFNTFPGLPTTYLLRSINNFLFSEIWIIAQVLFISFLFTTAVVFREKRSLFFITLILLSAVIGSGFLSPVSFIPVYLYTHFPGYQLLNGSYYWDWIIIVPSFSLLSGLIIECLLTTSTFRLGNRVAYFSNKLESRRRVISRNGAVSICVVISFIIIMPLVGQGFYGDSNSGIHPTNVPNSYNILTKQLNEFVNKSQLGVAYFTPDNYVFFGNNTNGEAQPLLSSNIRSPGIPSYGSPPVISSNFFYWVYTEFYLNQTHSIAQIMGLMGIKYFVTLNNVISASSLFVANYHNPTKLMEYQKDMKLLRINDSYSIFESTININVAQSVKTFTLMSGNYESLLNSAALGVDISHIAPVFPGDINQQNFEFYLGNTSSLVLLNEQSLTSVAIDKFTNNTNSVNPLNYANNYFTSPEQGWVSSSSLWYTNKASIINDAYSYVITSTNLKMAFTMHASEPGSYKLWLYTLNSASKNAQLGVSLNNERIMVNTTGHQQNLGNFSWVNIPANLTGKTANITIQSLKGTNGIERIVLLKRGIVSSELSKLNDTINSGKLKVLYINRFHNVQPAKSANLIVKFTIHNSQNTPAGTYQQLINVPSYYYSSLANSNLSNIEWQYSNGTVISSWLQSFNRTDSNWWLKISNISAYSNLTIYMVFYNTYLRDPHSMSDGLSTFDTYNDSGLLGSGRNIYYQTNNHALYFYTKFYNPSGLPGNQGLVGWNYNGGIDIPMFSGLSNVDYFQPYYYSNGTSHYLSPHLRDGQYYLLATGMTFSKAYWMVNGTVIQTTNNSNFVGDSPTFVRSTGINISVLYSFITTLPPNNVMPEISIENLSVNRTVNYINSLCLGQVPLNVSNNPNGFSISGNLSQITLVRYGYFQGMLDVTGHSSDFPIMGGLGFVLVNDKGLKSVSFISKDYGLLLYGEHNWAPTKSRKFFVGQYPSQFNWQDG